MQGRVFQNRTIEGDTVAVQVFPEALWRRSNATADLSTPERGDAALQQPQQGSLGNDHSACSPAHSQTSAAQSAGGDLAYLSSTPSGLMSQQSGFSSSPSTATQLPNGDLAQLSSTACRLLSQASGMSQSAAESVSQLAASPESRLFDEGIRERLASLSTSSADVAQYLAPDQLAASPVINSERQAAGEELEQKGSRMRAVQHIASRCARLRTFVHTMSACERVNMRSFKSTLAFFSISNQVLQMHRISARNQVSAPAAGFASGHALICGDALPVMGSGRCINFPVSLRVKPCHTVRPCLPCC